MLSEDTYAAMKTVPQPDTRNTGENEHHEALVALCEALVTAREKREQERLRQEARV